MKKTIKTSRSAGYLEKMFRRLNEDSFGGILEEPIITIQSTPGAYGHVTVAKAWKRGDERRHELNISADWLNRPIEEVVATMLHEMVHLWNLQHDIQDCSRGGSYHNRKFKEEAEKHMLQIEKHETYGWTITKITDELLEYILKQGWEDFEMNRGFLGGFSGPSGDKSGSSPKPTVAGMNGTEKPKGSNSRRYVCPCCKAIVRTTKDLHIICGTCNVDFELS